MIFPYQPELVEEAGRHFDKVVSKIMARDFEVKTMPEKKYVLNVTLGNTA